MVYHACEGDPAGYDHIWNNWTMPDLYRHVGMKNYLYRKAQQE